MELFLDWVWDRHHNILSWYVRPLFLLPYCYFAFQRNAKYLVITLLLFPTSLFWFPAPEQASDQVVKYLAWEHHFLTQGSTIMQVSMISLVILFLGLLALAFWKRSLLYGLVVLHVGTACKVIWSLYFAGDIGKAAILPSIVSLLVCNVIAYLFYRFKLR